MRQEQANDAPIICPPAIKAWVKPVSPTPKPSIKDPQAEIQIAEDLKVRITEVREDQLTVLAKAYKKAPSIDSQHKYWEYKGYPKDSAARLTLCSKLMTEDPTNFGEHLFLFDSVHDKDDANWINILAYIYDTHTNKNPFFKPELAYALSLHAARLGSLAAHYNIAGKYAEGHETNIDPEKAAYWYELAFESGHGCAGTPVFNIRVKDPRYGHPDHQDFTDEVNAIPDKMEDMQAPWGHLWKARLIAGGWTNDNDISGAIGRYSYFIKHKDNFCQPPVLESAWALGLRHFLGFDVDWSMRLSQKHLEHIPRESNSVHVKYGLRWNADLLKAVITKASSTEASQAAYIEALELVQKMKDGLLTINQFKTMVDKGEIVPSDPLIESLWAAAQLEEAEQWKRPCNFRKAARLLLQKEMGLEDDILYASRMIMGPRYNPLNEYGFPVMGALELPSQNEETIARERAERGHYVPMPGIVAIHGLSTTPDGEIIYDCEISKTQPALLVKEDFDVCLSLIFGNVAKPIWPSLSLEPVRITPIKDAVSSVNIKSWDPAWLGHTDFGRTLMIADYFAGTLVWQYNYLGIVEPKDSMTQDLHDLGRALVEELSLLGGRDGEGQSGRIMLHPRKMKFDPQKKKHFLKGDTYEVPLIEGKMLIDGAYWSRKTDGTEDRSVALNDPTFKNGKAAKFVSDEFDKVSLLMPIFERSRQMMILLHALATLRETGWRPNAGLQASFTQKLKYFEALPAIPYTELHCL